MKEYINESIKKLDEQLKEGAPNCVEVMKPRLIEYIEGEKMVMAFPVLEWQLNPRDAMQGGFITAAFDNVFGTLCIYETKEKSVATVDISTTYQRPIFKGDELIVTAWVKFRGKTLVHILGEGYNKEGKLIATASSNFILLNNKNN